jgi:hypothetical protein
LQVQDWLAHQVLVEMELDQEHLRVALVQPDHHFLSLERPQIMRVAVEEEVGFLLQMVVLVDREVEVLAVAQVETLELRELQTQVVAVVRVP